MKRRKMFGPAFLRRRVSMLGSVGGLNLLLTSRANNHLHLAFGEMTTKALWASFKKSPVRNQPPGRNVPPSVLQSRRRGDDASSTRPV